MSVIFRTPSSYSDYGDIWDYVAMKASPDMADRLLRAFDEKLNLISEFPGIGQLRPELTDGLRSFPVGDYLIFYRPVSGGIELIRVVHGARNLERLFRSR